mgnify:CR=1 FL=1
MSKETDKNDYSGCLTTIFVIVVNVVLLIIFFEPFMRLLGTLFEGVFAIIKVVAVIAIIIGIIMGIGKMIEK